MRAPVPRVPPLLRPLLPLLLALPAPLPRARAQSCPQHSTGAGNGSACDCAAGYAGGIFNAGPPASYSVCTLCSWGKAKVGVGSGLCDSCGGTVLHSALVMPTGAQPYPGQVDHDRDASTACQDCIGSGRYSTLGDDGTAGNLISGVVQCPLCPAGKEDHDSKPGTACRDCAAGRFGGFVSGAVISGGATTCESCARGFFDDDFCSTMSADGSVCSAVNTNSPATPCVKCSAGRVSPFLESTSCELCDPGTYTDDLRVQCIKCPAGFYDHDASRLSAATECIICPAGSQTGKPDGSTDCSLCFAGSHAPQNGTVTCTTCPLGTFSSDGAIECAPCAPGFADTDAEPATECVYCKAGEYAPLQSTNCTRCARGRHDHDSNPSTACVQCAGGKYSLEGTLSCLPCPAGKFATSGAPECKLCGAGRYSLSQAVSCIRCVQGKYSNNGSTSCASCSVGMFDHDACNASYSGGGAMGGAAAPCIPINPESAATPCVACDSGRHSLDGATSCPECEAGKYDHDQTATTACTLCRPGQYDLRYGHDGVGQPPPRTTCASCNKGRYLDRQGSTSIRDCQICSENTFAGFGAPACEQCPSYLNRDYTFIVEGRLAGNRSLNGMAAGSVLRMIGATSMVACVCNAGHFAAKDYVADDWECSECPNRDACLGGSSISPRGTCDEGYEGEWCQSCASNWFAFEVECIRCPGNPSVRIAVFFILLLIFVSAMIKVSSMAREDEDGINLFKGVVTPIAIILSRAQVLASISNLDANWPRFVLKAAWIFLHLANVDLPSVVYPECQFDFDGPAGVLLFRVVFNALLYILACLFIFSVFVYYAARKMDYSALINGVIAAFSILFILLIRVAFRSADCTYLDGQWRMDLNRQVVCLEAEFWPIFFVGFAMFILYGIVIPLLLWNWLPYGDLGEEDMLKKFGWMYARYRPACYYYEWVIMGQKAAVAAFTTFLSNESSFKFSWPVLVIITLGSLALQLKLMPYREAVLMHKGPKPAPHRDLETVLEDSDEMSGGQLPMAKPKRVWLGRPKPLTQEEQLVSSIRSWKGTKPSMMCKRWAQAFVFPQSLNSLEVIGLTAQLLVLAFAAYFGFGAEIKGECKVDGRVVEYITSLTGCDNVWGGQWTPAASSGFPFVVGVLCLAAPAAFVLVGLVAIVDNTLEFVKQRKKEAELRAAEGPQDGLHNASGRGAVWTIVSTFKAMANRARNDSGMVSPGRPSSATRPRSVVHRDTAKVNKWLQTQSVRRRSSTPSGEPRSLGISDITLDTTYELSDWCKTQYEAERDGLLGNKSTAGKVQGFQLGVGNSPMDQLLPEDRSRLIFIQWRLREDKVIKAEKERLLDIQQNGVDEEDEEDEGIELKPHVKRMIFILKFIAKISGPWLRNNALLFEQMNKAKDRTIKKEERRQRAEGLIKSSLVTTPGGTTRPGRQGSQRRSGSTVPSTPLSRSRERSRSRSRGLSTQGSHGESRGKSRDGERSSSKSRRSRTRSRSRSNSRGSMATDASHEVDEFEAILPGTPSVPTAPSK
jgi:hypothetical protein